MRYRIDERAVPGEEGGGCERKARVLHTAARGLISTSKVKQSSKLPVGEARWKAKNVIAGPEVGARQRLRRP